jgi:hypothetical protein
VTSIFVTPTVCETVAFGLGSGVASWDRAGGADAASAARTVKKAELRVIFIFSP